LIFISSARGSSEKGQNKACMCLTNWCGQYRNSHLFSNSTVSLPSDPGEKEVWMNHLQVKMGDECNDVSQKDRPRVWLGHIHENDWIIESDEYGFVTCKGVDFSKVTKLQNIETGNNSKNAPPRPIVTKQMITSSQFINKISMTMNEYSLLIGTDINQRSKRARRSHLLPLPPIASVAKVLTYKEPQPSEPKLRSDTTLYHENYIGIAHNLIDAFKAMNDHGKLCVGNLNVRRSDCHTNRFTLMVKLTCSLKKKKGVCTAGWENSMYKFQSVPNIEISPGRLVPITDVLYTTAVSMTPTTMDHADRLFVAMQLTPPSRNLYKEICKLTSAQYLEAEKERLVDMACAEAKKLGVPISVCMDCGHSSARNSEAACLAIASGNRLIASRTDTKNNAYHKEAILVGEALNFIINEKKLDVVSVDIDDNAQNAKMITAFNRVNGPEDTKDEPVRCGLDIFHAIKAMGKNALKRLTELLKLFQKHFKNFSEKKFCIENVIENLLTSVVSKSNEFFDDISKSFESHGAISWKIASESPEAMNAFAIENNLMDKVPPRNYWDPVVTAWNLIFVKDNVTSVSRMKIRVSFSIRTIKLSAEAVCAATGGLLLARVVATYEADETSKNLGLGPGELKMTEFQNDGNAVSTFKESVTSARPVCPYPFLNENLLNEDQIYRIQNIWESTRLLKRQRENDDDNLNNSLCSICDNDITDDKVACSKCDMIVHLSCYQEEDSEWIMISDDYICKNCKNL
jgi:hypothetical protein